MAAKVNSLTKGQEKFVHFVLSLTGLSYVAAGVALTLIPAWFLDHVGRFPPFNRHYMGDAGAFVLALGVGIWLIRKEPWAHPSMLIAGLVGTQAHALNHLYDAGLHADLQHWLQDALPNTLIGVLYLVAFLLVWRTKGRA